MKNSFDELEKNDATNLKNEILRYVSFWPYLLLLIFVSIFSSFIYLRYTSFTYSSTASIEIMDPAQDTEMALPTSLTVFNRSMINLENEVNRLKSFSLNKSVVKKLSSNILFYKLGRLKNTQSSAENWYDEYKIDFNINTENIEKKSSFLISTEDNKLEISLYDSGDNFIKSVKFNSLSTLEIKHDLPFELSVKNDKDLSFDRRLVLMPVDILANKFRRALEIDPLGSDSDQLSISLTYENPIIAQNYINNLMISFDDDGVSDRRLEYSRTIEFVNQRERILKEDLAIIELRKQKYKQENNLSDISVDATNNIDLKYTYNSEIFQLESQKQIAQYLIDLISETGYDYLPINIGIENIDLNNMINGYNVMVSDRNRYLNEAGSNNFLVKSLEPQLDDIIQNLSISLNNFISSTDLKLENLKLKESEFDFEYNRVPENEKTLRSIERELSIKEALYLLLLQKREEASINLAVVKPTIKIIDYAITDYSSKKPNSLNIYFTSIIIAIFIYFAFLYVWFFMDNKIHNKDQLTNLIDNNIPIIGEIPFIKDIDSLKDNQSKRSVISESIRMLLSNLRFTSLNNSNSNNAEVFIFTSSIKGEGKTLASVNTALSLANDLGSNKKVILLGTDLRNPQVHKNFGVEKNKAGISEIIYRNDYKNYKDYINVFENLDVIFSGAIPPNPTSMLSSNMFKDLISKLKNDYDYIIVDSAPCLLVSDTLQYIDLADSVIYLFRSNFTDSKITDFINEMYVSKKINNLNVVLNAVGNSASYGYKYGYQYGYKYGYKYAYNYGYGYGYSADKE